MNVATNLQLLEDVITVESVGRYSVLGVVISRFQES